MLFIAGGISGCEDWQKEFAARFKDEDLIILNPRRSNYDMKDPYLAREQINWEHEHLALSDAVSFWFPKETLCPITLFELGKESARFRPLFVGVHPQYARRLDIEVQLRLQRPDVMIVYDLQSLANQVKEWLETGKLQ